MCIRYRNLPYANVGQHGDDEFAEGQRYDDLEVKRPAEVGELTNAPEVEERSRVDGDGEQLDHGNGHGIRKLCEYFFGDHIIT